MTKITKPFVEAALELADNSHSKLGERENELYGRSSPRLRAFINNICSKEGTNYLEIGLDRGATFISAFYGNETCKAVGIDNFRYDEKEFTKVPKEEDAIWENMRSHLYDNLGRYEYMTSGVPVGSYTVIENSFQEVDWEELPIFDICFFDVTPVNDEIYDAFFDKVLPNMAWNSVIIFSNYSNSLHAEQLEKAFNKHADKLNIQWKSTRISGGLSDITHYFSGIGIFGIARVKQSKTANTVVEVTANTVVEVTANTVVDVTANTVVDVTANTNEGN